MIIQIFDWIYKLIEHLTNFFGPMFWLLRRELNRMKCTCPILTINARSRDQCNVHKNPITLWCWMGKVRDWVRKWASFLPSLSLFDDHWVKIHFTDDTCELENGWIWGCQRRFRSSSRQTLWWLFCTFSNSNRPTSN